jgi:hypothetical protein
MNPGDIVLGSCSRVGCNRHGGLSQVINVKKTSYGWSRLILLCSCGYNYEGSTLQHRKMQDEDQANMIILDEVSNERE